MKQISAYVIHYVFICVDMTMTMGLGLCVVVHMLKTRTFTNCSFVIFSLTTWGWLMVFGLYLHLREGQVNTANCNDLTLTCIMWFTELWSQFLSNHMGQVQGTWWKFTRREGQVNTVNCNNLTLTCIIGFTELWSQFLSNHMGQVQGTWLKFIHVGKDKWKQLTVIIWH